VAASVDLKQLAKNALNPIEKKLKGIYTVGKERPEKEISTSSLVRILVEEAMDLGNLVRLVFVSSQLQRSLFFAVEDVSWMGIMALRRDH
jgi:hypothetical protein